MSKTRAETKSTFGPCCACGKDDASVVNIVALERRAPVPGTGWGCVVCALPSDGAMVVVCDRCLEANRPYREVVSGYLREKQRIPFAMLDPAPFKHDLDRHADARVSVREPGPEPEPKLKRDKHKARPSWIGR